MIKFVYFYFFVTGERHMPVEIFCLMI